eukprot:TRINITY_DN623_c0_g2_i3.p2 TRINITY_DN623_c0_g2~~TRINITY_DN623_c0_g2_i3.p2  ORF type:complete len:117 (+),score=6.07 TRINITY_DN623_c0_g2_i3:319-669(+)
MNDSQGLCNTHTPVAPNQPEERKANSLTLPPPRPNNDDYVSMQVNEYRQARESGARNSASNNNSSERKGVIAYFKSFECDSITKLTTCCCMTICVGIGVLFIMSLQNAHPHNLQPI